MLKIPKLKVRLIKANSSSSKSLNPDPNPRYHQIS